MATDFVKAGKFRFNLARVSAVEVLEPNGRGARLRVYTADGDHILEGDAECAAILAGVERHSRAERVMGLRAVSETN